jgi:FkbM family methyltransferase
MYHRPMRGSTIIKPAKGSGALDAAIVAYARGSAHPSKIRLIRWIIRHVAGGRIGLDYPGKIGLVIDPLDAIGWSLLTTGHYEPASLGRAIDIVRQQPGPFIDVGANFGLYTCAIAGIGDAVVSIEPNSETCSQLCLNIARNKFTNVAILNAAAGSGPGIAKIEQRSPANSGTMAIADGKNFNGTWAAMATLDAIMKEIIRPASRPTLIKIDVEGFERQVLDGMDFDGQFRPHNIMLEFIPSLSPGWSLPEMREYFNARNYDLLDVFGEYLADNSAPTEDNVWARDRQEVPLAS